MKNFVFISPHFPVCYYHFVESLKNNGFRVLGIGDAPYEELDEHLKASLTEYYQCLNMEDIANEIRAVQYFVDKYGPIDYLESNNEYWLNHDATLREWFNIKTGIFPQQLELYQHKSTMKKYYQEAGCPVAQYIIVDRYDSLLDFVNKVGYPVFIKPDIGVGASISYKIKNIEDLDRFFNEKDPNITFICEQMLSGTIVSFDGIADENSDVVFMTSNIFPPSVSDVKEEGLDFFYYCVKDVPEKLQEIGTKVVKSFGLKKRFFHSEYFLLDKDIKGVGKKGDYVGLEVNIRTPGGYTPDLINYANSINCYQIYADVIADKPINLPERENFIAGCASRRDGIEYFFSNDDVLRTFSKEIKQTGRYPKVFSDIMGDTYYMAVFKTLKEVEVFKQYVSKRNQGTKYQSKHKSYSSVNICDAHEDGA